MKDPRAVPEVHNRIGQQSDKRLFSVFFGLKPGKNQHNFMLICLTFGVIASIFWLLWRQVQQDTGIRDLVAIVNRLPENEQLKPIACSRTPLVDGADKVTLQKVVLHLPQPSDRATAFCLLGDYPSALKAYFQAASAGNDKWSELQVYFLEARKGDKQAANQALSGNHFSIAELEDFYTLIIKLKLNIDLLPLAEHMVDLNPGDQKGWMAWLNAAREYELFSNWQSALYAYSKAILTQEQVGVEIDRSSFEMRMGEIYQINLQPNDLNTALIHYNRAIAYMDFLEPTEMSDVYLYRGEVYQGLRPAFTSLQALQEFSHSLTLNPQNYWAMHAIAIVYLWDLKNYTMAEDYINQAITQNPDLPHAYVTRGDIYEQEGDLNKALLSYHEALVHQPNYQPAIDQITAVQAELQKKQAP